MQSKNKTSQTPFKTWETATGKAELWHGIFLPNRQRVYHAECAGKKASFFTATDESAILKAQEIMGSPIQSFAEAHPASTDIPPPPPEAVAPQTTPKDILLVKGFLAAAAIFVPLILVAIFLGQVKPNKQSNAAAKGVITNPPKRTISNQDSEKHPAPKTSPKPSPQMTPKFRDYDNSKHDFDFLRKKLPPYQKHTSQDITRASAADNQDERVAFDTSIYFYDKAAI